MLGGEGVVFYSGVLENGGTLVYLTKFYAQVLMDVVFV